MVVRSAGRALPWTFRDESINDPSEVEPMSRGLLRRRLTSDATIARVVQALCFAAGPAVLIVALRALPRFAGTPFEVFLGVLASSAVALLLVVLGLLVPMSRGEAKG